jgi:hypothetical protein
MTTLNEDIVVRVSRLVRDSIDPEQVDIVILGYVGQILRDYVESALQDVPDLTITVEIQR